ncbi:hypothetical protein [Streptomyces sp. NBC_01304]|uniref:hypothetical protein n=1 Tax=Streptomyces sp. NBC_01304 TaxID=2903818 RepID=UPI002E129A8C|nr:hypothetical protein OG430_48745 [Streptomyces sp. NBC_01304]
MPLFLPETHPYSPKGPDGQGWNRLSLNAHFETRNQCGLLPIRYATLFESRTGRQRWGGYERCSEGGACGTCPVSNLALDHRPLADWPAASPLLLGRVKPWPLASGMPFSDPAGGRSDVHLETWQGEDTGVKVDWQSLRNDFDARIGWVFRDNDDEVFWIVRDNPAAGSALVRTKRYATLTRHALYGGPGQGRVALLSCHGGCAHEDHHLQHLAADIASLGAGELAQSAAALPPALPGTPRITFGQEGARTVMRYEAGRDHPRSTLHISWDNAPRGLGGGAAAAVLAHAVRLCAAG